MKNKIFILIVFSLLLSNFIYKNIWNFKYNNCKRSMENKYQENTNHNITTKILKNNFTELIINKGSNDNIKINMISFFMR